MIDSVALSACRDRMSMICVSPLSSATCMCVCVCVCVCACVYTRTCVRACIHTRTHTHTQYVRVYTYTHTRARAHTHTHKDTARAKTRRAQSGATCTGVKPSRFLSVSEAPFCSSSLTMFCAPSDTALSPTHPPDRPRASSDPVSCVRVCARALRKSGRVCVLCV